MADMIARGMAWLAATMSSKAATAVTYETDSDSVSVLATRAITEFEVEDGTGMAVTGHVVDFIISAALFEIEPVPGHRIIDAGRVYEVSKFSDEDCWRWSNAHKTARRIHTRDLGDDV